MSRSEGVGPSVTQVLELTGLGPDVERIPLRILERACQRGIETHRIIELANTGELDEDLISTAAMPCWQAWNAFCFAYDPVVVDQEITIQIDKPLPYHGRYDMRTDISGKRWLIDIKTSHAVEKRYCMLQLAGYSVGVASPTNAAVLHLKKDGTFRFIDLSSYIDGAVRAFFDLLKAWYAMHDYDQWSEKVKEEIKYARKKKA